MYALCEFTGRARRELAVIPVIWLTQNNTKCSWPTGGTQEKLEKLIKEAAVPKKSWKIYNIKLLYLCPCQEEAEKKLDIYIKDSAQESEDTGNSSLLIERKKIEEQRYSVSEDEETNVSSNIIVTPSTSFSSISTLTPTSSSGGNTTDVMKQILLTLNEVVANQEQQSMMMNEIIRIHRVNSNSIDLQKPEGLPEMPLKTLEDMNKLNNLLENINCRTYMTNRLSAIGGVTVETLTRRILKYVLTNEVAALYNWKGREKLSFEKCNLKTVIYDAVKKSFPQGEGDDLKIANCIKDWLKFAKLRMASKRKNN